MISKSCSRPDKVMLTFFSSRNLIFKESSNRKERKRDIKTWLHRLSANLLAIGDVIDAVDKDAVTVSACT